jgi:hypothetical protein
MPAKSLPWIAALLTLSISVSAQTVSREDWGGMPVTVAHAGGNWTITGQKNTVTLRESDLAINVQTPGTNWTMAGSQAGDLIVKAGGKVYSLRLADAKKIEVVPYDAGYKTGVKIALSGWRHLKAARGKTPADLTLYLTVCLEGRDEEAVFDVAADEHAALVRQLDWPPAMDARDVDYTVLSNGRGNLLPRNWPQEYYPIRSVKNGKIVASDHSVLQSHVIESWSMSWWGFEKGKTAMMMIVETPDDAAYQFSHPAGGPTVIGPRWLSTLGRLGYVRTARMCFFDDGNYVTLAKRYRQYVKDTGLFVSLAEKIARTPGLAEVVGTPQTRIGFLRDLSPDSDRYDKANPSNNYSLFTCDERIKQLQALKAGGVDKTLVFIGAWQHLGYDHQHPDPLPPPEKAGGWDGLKRLTDTCRELGYPFLFHDQYRDYYTNAPSYDPQFAIHEEDDSLPPKAFAGSRFGDWKEGAIPFMRHWDGGGQTYLNARFQAGNVRKNWQLFFDHGIHPQGIYIDVVGYVPPDEDYNPEHPTTRSEAMQGQIASFEWAHNNLGYVATEAGSDWVVPYADIINQSGGVGKCIPVPLYNLVYHDAIMISYGGRGDDAKNLLLGILCGGVPELPVTAEDTDSKRLALTKEMAALNKRVALVEMTNHEFLDKDRNEERTTYTDGTTVTVDWKAGTVKVSPELN